MCHPVYCKQRTLYATLMNQSCSGVGGARVAPANGRGGEGLIDRHKEHAKNLQYIGNKTNTQ